MCQYGGQTLLLGPKHRRERNKTNTALNFFFSLVRRIRGRRGEEGGGGGGGGSVPAARHQAAGLPHPPLPLHDPLRLHRQGLPVHGHHLRPLWPAPPPPQPVSRDHRSITLRWPKHIRLFLAPNFFLSWWGKCAHICQKNL